MLPFWPGELAMGYDEYWVGSIAVWSSPTIPKGWLPCDGRALPINQYMSLFSLLSTHFGGNGTSTFNLPDLRGMAVAGAHLGGGSAPDFATGGMEAVALGINEMPAHNHALMGSKAPGNATAITNAVPASAGTSANVHTPPAIYATPGQTVQLDPASIGGGGSNPAAPHPNMQPYLPLQFIIAVEGQFPPHS